MFQLDYSRFLLPPYLSVVPSFRDILPVRTGAYQFCTVPPGTTILTKKSSLKAKQKTKTRTFPIHVSAARTIMSLPTTFLGQILLQHHVLPTNVEIIQDNAKSYDEKCIKRLSLNPPGSLLQQEPRCRWRRALIRQASDGKLCAPVRRRGSLLETRGCVSDSNLLRDAQPETSIDQRSPWAKLVRQVNDEKLTKPVRRGSNDCYSSTKSPKCRWKKLNWKDLSGAGDSKLCIPSRTGSMDTMQQSCPETLKRTVLAAMA
jgi:hypothetical protein